jgi:hypothetical protein
MSGVRLIDLIGKPRKDSTGKAKATLPWLAITFYYYILATSLTAQTEAGENVVGRFR